MFYLIRNANSSLEIFDDSILKTNSVWSCNSLVKSIKTNDSKLYYITAGGNEIYAGEILSMTERKKCLKFVLGLNIKLEDGNWYKIVRPEGFSGLYIVIPKKLDDGTYIQTFKNVCDIRLNEIQDVKC